MSGCFGGAPGLLSWWVVGLLFGSGFGLMFGVYGCFIRFSGVLCFWSFGFGLLVVCDLAMDC